MEDIIEQLRQELLQVFCEYVVDSFIGYLKTDSQLLKTLELNYENGKNLCLEIISRAKK